MTHLSPHDALPCSGDLAPVSMLEITHRDADGELLARPLEWKSTLPPPSIVITPEPKKGRSAERDAEPPAGVGDRVLARMTKTEAEGETYNYEARVKIGRASCRERVCQYV